MRPDLVDRPDNVQPAYPRRPWMLAALGLLVVAILVLVAQLSSGEQRANNWINGTSAAIAMLNVLLTFYLLRTAQIQLHIFRGDLENQQIRHERELAEREARRAEEARQARAELENTQTLLNTQTEALILARSDAQEAQRETARARYDNVAPRCVLQLSQVKALARKKSMPANEWRRPHELERSVTEIDDTFLRVTLIFDLKNWGDEPVLFSTGSPLTPAGDGILDPLQTAKFTWEVTHLLRWWKQVHDGVIKSENDVDHPQMAKFAILVQNVGGDVVDHHMWESIVNPVEVGEFGVTVRSDDEISYPLRRVAIPTRQYIHLRSDELPDL